MANKKISIKDRDKQVKKSKKERDKVYHKVKASKLYSGVVITFLTMLVVTIFSPIVTGKSYDYTSVELNEPLVISNSLVLKVTDMQMNREKGLLKIVINYEDESNAKSLSNIKYEYKLNYIENKNNEEVKTEIIEVSEKHTVIYYENLPKNFGVISVTVTPRYVYPELEASDDLLDKEIKFYAVDGDIKDNKKLNVKNDSELKQESFEYQIKIINDSIKEEEDKIELANVAIELANKDIISLEENLEFQTSEEKIETQNTISTKENAISVQEESIELSKNNMLELSKKIDMLEENVKKVK